MKNQNPIVNSGLKRSHFDIFFHKILTEKDLEFFVINYNQYWGLPFLICRLSPIKQAIKSVKNSKQVALRLPLTHLLPCCKTPWQQLQQFTAAVCRLRCRHLFALAFTFLILLLCNDCRLEWRLNVQCCTLFACTVTVVSDTVVFVLVFSLFLIRCNRVLCAKFLDFSLCLVVFVVVVVVVLPVAKNGCVAIAFRHTT